MNTLNSHGNSRRQQGVLYWLCCGRRKILWLPASCTEDDKFVWNSKNNIMYQFVTSSIMKIEICWSPSCFVFLFLSYLTFNFISAWLAAFRYVIASLLALALNAFIASSKRISIINGTISKIIANISVGSYLML